MLSVLRSRVSNNIPRMMAASMQSRDFSAEPVRIALTGAAGAIGYSMVFRIASGGLFGPNQPVILNLIELPGAMKALQGVVMELDDCAFPLLKGVVQTDSLEKGFDGVDYAFLVGAKPRTKGMERADLLKDNGAIFSATGKAMDKFAKKTCKTLIVGNPANTNTLIAATHAPSIPAENFSAMMRLDHNRALGQLAKKTGVAVEKIEKLAVWGNHSPTQYPDISHATINGKSARSAINDDAWVKDTFIPVVQQRGAEILAARGASSAASAGNAALDHMRDWVNGTNGKWVSMTMPSDGSYGITAGLFFSFPCTVEKGKVSVVKGLTVDEFSSERIKKSLKELAEERDAVKHLL